MVLWRISRHLDLSGKGGMRANARWHRAGTPVVYLSESPSSALLEVCVHTASNRVPEDFTLLRVEGPDVNVSTVPEGYLSEDWAKQSALTQELGTDWLSGNTGVLLRVPSAIVPYTSNYLFNPVHPLAGDFRIVQVTAWPFDGRIKQ